MIRRFPGDDGGYDDERPYPPRRPAPDDPGDLGLPPTFPEPDPIEDAVPIPGTPIPAPDDSRSTEGPRDRMPDDPNGPIGPGNATPPQPRQPTPRPGAGQVPPISPPVPQQPMPMPELASLASPRRRGLFGGSGGLTGGGLGAPGNSTGLGEDPISALIQQLLQQKG